MKPAKNGKHFGPPLVGVQERQSLSMRARGFDTVSERTYLALIAAGYEPDEFAGVELDEDGMPSLV